MNTARHGRVDIGFIDRSDRPRLAVAGPDRAKFLHNLTTNDVKRLPVGKGCEAFVTSPQGKTLGYVSLISEDDRILLRADPGGLAHVLPHLEKYGVFDDVTLDDETARTFEFHLAGDQVFDWLEARGTTLPEGGDLSHVVARCADCQVRLIREAPTGRPGVTLIGDLADSDRMVRWLHAEGAAEIAPADFETMRIEAGTPVFGRDLTVENLAQEVGRDARAINFVKGCYLGQETVARLDALGHVNKILRGLKIEGETVPPAGAELERDGKKVGTVTSSAFSPGWGRPIALAYVRIQHAEAGTPLRVVSEGRSAGAFVADLPMPPPE